MFIVELKQRMGQTDRQTDRLHCSAVQQLWAVALDLYGAIY